jgi:hypothetical protein
MLVLYFAQIKNGALNKQSAFVKTKLFLHSKDGVLRGLGHAKLHDFLGLDLDRFTGGRITSNPDFALDQYQLAQSRNGK